MSAPDDSGSWTALDEHLHVRQSRAYWMNSVVLLDSEHTVIVDPGILPSEIEEIARLVRQAEPEQVSLLLTHGHWDHVLGRPWWPKASVIAHDACAAEMRARVDRIRSESQRIAAEHGEKWSKTFEPFGVDQAVSGQRFMKLDPWRLVLRDAFGHSDSQLSVHLPELGILIAADMLSDIEIPILNRPPDVYRGTLETLLTLAEGGAFEILIPGHGGIAFGRDSILGRLRADLDYLAALQRGVTDSRTTGGTLEAAREKLDALEYIGKHSTVYPTVEFHQRNIGVAWEGAGKSG